MAGGEMVSTYSSNTVKQRFVNQRLLHTILLALPSASMTIADGRPRPVDPGAATTEQEIIVQLIFLRRASAAERSRGPYIGISQSFVHPLERWRDL